MNGSLDKNSCEKYFSLVEYNETIILEVFLIRISLSTRKDLVSYKLSRGKSYVSI